MKYPLSFNTWNQKEISAVIKVIKSGNYTMGKEVAKFEKNFAKKFNSKFAVMVNSGSSANLLIITLLKYYDKIIKKKIRKPNIIVPAIGWSTSYFPIAQMGYELNFVDVDLKTLNIDTQKIEKSIDKNTIAILAINLLGNPCDFNSLNKISKKHKLVLIEDNCESMSATLNKKYCGTFGLMSSHSLFFAHHMQTMEGGVILTNNKDINNYLKSLRAHGWCRDLPKKNRLYKFKGNEFEDKFKFITPGYSLRPLEIEAAAGLEQLKKLDKFISLRIKNAKLFKSLFEKKEWCEIQKEERNAISSWYGFNIVLKGKLSGKRKKIINKLIKNKIETRPTMTGNFLKNPVLKKIKYKNKFKLKNADYIDRNGFFVGNYPKNLSNQIRFLYKVIKDELN